MSAGIALFPPAARAGELGPRDHGFLSWSFDLATGLAGLLVPTAGLLNLNKARVDQAGLVSNISMVVTSAGVTLTAGQNFAALFSAAGTLLGVTASQHTAWQTTGAKTMALVTPAQVEAGYVYWGFFCNGSTLPTFARGAQQNAPGLNIGLAAPNLRCCTADAGLTTAMPATFGAQTASAVAWWGALS